MEMAGMRPEQEIEALEEIGPIFIGTPLDVSVMMRKMQAQGLIDFMEIKQVESETSNADKRRSLLGVIQTKPYGYLPRWMEFLKNNMYDEIYYELKAALDRQRNNPMMTQNTNPREQGGMQNSMNNLMGMQNMMQNMMGNMMGSMHNNHMGMGMNSAMGMNNFASMNNDPFFNQSFGSNSRIRSHHTRNNMFQGQNIQGSTFPNQMPGGKTVPSSEGMGQGGQPYYTTQNYGTSGQQLNQPMPYPQGNSSGSQHDSAAYGSTVSSRFPGSGHAVPYSNQNTPFETPNKKPGTLGFEGLN